MYRSAGSKNFLAFTVLAVLQWLSAFCAVPVAVADSDIPRITKGIEASDSSAGAFRFENFSAALGDLTHNRSWGIAWADYDNDGWVDVFLNNHANPATMLRNIGGTSFIDVSASLGLNVVRDQHTCHWADFENDGDFDLYCVTGSNHGKGLRPANFWRNDAARTFTDVADSLNVGNKSGRGRSVSWLDIDLDGDLDLFIGNRVTEISHPVSVLYRYDADSFTEIGEEAGVGLPGLVTFSTATDYEEDGDWDLFVVYKPLYQTDSSCVRCVLVLQNDGLGRFRGLDSSETGIGSRWIDAMALGDYDNDGDIDLFSAGSAASQKHLYRNDGYGTYSSVSLTGAGLSAMLAESIRQATWADFDNDGWLDLFLIIDDTNGHRPNMLFLSNGDGTFGNQTGASGIEGSSTGLDDVAALADFDNDGFLDVMIGNGAEQATGPYELFRNAGNSNHWLRVRLKGTPFATASGSKIWLTAGGSTQFREYAGSGDGHAFHEPIVHFGIGTATSVDSLIIRWPNGSLSELDNAAADQLITISSTLMPADRVPIVTVSAPADDATFDEGEVVSFAGTAMDAEDGPLTSSLDWVSDRDGWIGSGAGFSTSTLTVGTHVVTASVTDSGGLAGAASISVAIGVPANTAPEVTIGSPADDATFDEGETVSFAATATDAEEGDLAGSLSWASNRDGVLGSGGALSSTTLSAGTHTITASVSDSSDYAGSDSVQIVIVAAGDPSAFTLVDIGDTFSNKGRPAANFGSKRLMRVHGPNDKKIGFVQFDVAGLSGTVAAAALKLYVQDVPDAGVVEVRAVQGAWTERGLKHNNKPAYGALLASVALSPADEGTVVSLDVTSLVQQWAAAPATAHGIALTSTNLHALFDTREAAHAPVIEVTLDGA